MIGAIDKIETVLVGVDGSPDSRTALRWAASFARATQRRLVVAHAWQHGRRLEGAFAAASTAAGGVAGLEADVVETLRRLAVEELGDESVVAGYRPVRGPIASALGSEATSVGAGLIVVGASGAGGARRTLLGSVCRQLTECPSHAVAVVPPHEVDDDPADRPVVVGVDGSDGSARALRWAGDSARRAGATVVAVHAFESPVPDPSPVEKQSLARERRQRLEEEWCAPLARLGVGHRAVFDQGDARVVLRRVAGEERPQYGVLGSRGLGPVSQRLLGSVTHRLVRELAWPTVVIPSARDRVVWPP